MATEIPASFGRWLRLRRRALDLTQESLALAAGCSVVTVRKLESDERRPSRQIAERLADALQIAAHERARFIGLARAEPYADQRQAPAALLQPPPTISPLRSLPLPLTRLLGRRAELAALRNRMLRGDTRLLTLTGLPGVGKTRLALQLGADLAPAFLDGVCFVDLAAVRQPELLLGALAQALGIRPSAGEPLEARLAAYLGDKRMLLLLDSFEHLLEAAPLLVGLLEHGPGLKAIVTSRAALRVRGEQVVPVAPLPVPQLGTTMGPRAVAQNPAVALFVERARAAQPGFALSDTTATLVAELCAHLEGLPLAIELVAARAAQLPLAALLSGLDQRLALLSDGPRDLPPRHQTLRAAIAESYELLDAGSQALFRRLGVCVGGWSLELAGALWAGVGPASAAPLPQLLAALAAQSLIGQRQGAEAPPRFIMLETIRAFALEQLVAAGEEQDARRAHRRQLGELAERARDELQGPRQVAWLNTLELEHPNLRAALEWSLGAGERGEALRLAGALEWFWFVRGHSDEGRRWLERALEGATPASVAAADRAVLAAALAAAGHLTLFQGDVAAARRRLEESAALWRTLVEQTPGDPAPQRGLAAALTFLVVALQFQGDSAARAEVVAEYLALHERLDDPRSRASLHFNSGRAALLQFGDLPAAREHLERSLELLHPLGDLWTMAQVLVDLGLVALYQGDAATARERYEQGLAIAQTLGDRALLALAFNNLGEVARAAGDDDTAAERYAASLQIHQELGNSTEVPRLLHNLGYVALHRGAAAQAAAHFRESVRRFAQLGMARGVAEALAGFAAVAAAEGRAADAARLWGAAEAIREPEGTPVWPADRQEQARYQGVARARIDPAAWDAAWQEGRAAPQAQLALLDQEL